MKIDAVYNKNSQVLTFASQQISYYLEKICEASASVFHISFAVRENPDAKNDWFAICAEASQLSIIANTERAVLLGVYHYLYRLGCRFLGPDNEVIPVWEGELPTLHVEKEASLYHRGVCIEGASSRENILSFIDWLPKVGYNSFFLQFTNPYAFLSRWYHHENNPYEKPETYTMEDAVKDMCLFEDEIAKRGLLLHKVGHGWTGAALGYETVSWDGMKIPLSKEKQEFLALRNGKRELYWGSPANTNLCYHKKESIQAFVDAVVSYASANPQVQYLHVWLADACNNICECEDCSKTTPSDQYVTMLNTIDERLTREHLDVKLVFLLYQELLWPPKKEKLLHPDRFVLMFAPITRTFEQSYFVDCKLPDICTYERNQITLPTNLEENQAFLQEWQKQFFGDSFVYDYPLGRAHYGDFGYEQISRIISQDIKKLHRMGLNGYISCQELRIMCPTGLPGYVMGRTLMDEQLSFEEILEEYYRAAYGEDWQMVHAYLGGLSELCSCDYVNGKGPRQDLQIVDHMQKISVCCAAWKEKLQGHEGRHWEVLRHHNHYIALLAKSVAHLANGDGTMAARLWNEMRDYVCGQEKNYQAELDVYRFVNITRDYTGLTSYQ